MLKTSLYVARHLKSIPKGPQNSDAFQKGFGEAVQGVCRADTGHMERPALTVHFLEDTRSRHHFPFHNEVGANGKAL